MEYPSLDKPTAGAFRFNTDTSQLEIYDGNQWTGVAATSPYIQTGGTRAICAGGYDDSASLNVIDYVNLSTTGNFSDFGDLTNGLQGCTFGNTSSRTRGLFGGGEPYRSQIDYITISHTGNAADFGDLTQNYRYLLGCASATRGLFGAGGTPSPWSVNNVEYVTIAATGNAVDFGDMQTATAMGGQGYASPTRGIFAKGENSPDIQIEYCTIATTGNWSDYGDLSTPADTNHNRGASNAVRGLNAGGYVPSPGAYTNTIDFLTIASIGSCIDFGDLSSIRASGICCTSPTRMIYAGGSPPNAGLVTVDFVEIMTKGNSTDFGDLTDARNTLAGVSNGHGGL